MFLNQQIFLFLNSLAGRNKILDYFFYFCAEYLAYVIIVFLLVYFLYKFYKSFFDFSIIKKLLIILTSSFVVWAISQLINHLYYNPRPFIALENINVLFEHGNGDSFPSGHTTFFTTLALMSYLYVPKWLANTLLVGVVLIGVSRVVSGVHWPYDILGAFVLSFVGFYLIRYFLSQKAK